MSETYKLIRALRAIGDLPLPQIGIGTRSTSMAGAFSYQDDMRAAKPHIANIRYALVYGEPIDEKDVKALEEITKKAIAGKKEADAPE